MKRETVKELLTLSDETLKDINFYRLVEHREVAQHYANGGDVEVNYGGYKPVDKPSFHMGVEYRKVLPEIEVFGVKVRANPPETEPLEWNKIYYCLNMESKRLYSPRYWYDCNIDYALLRNKAIWKKKDDIEAVVKALRGEE